MTKDLAVLGSTGSVGRSALQVCRSLGIRVEALSANSDINTLEMQIREFKPSLCAVADERAAAELKIAVADMPVKIVSGKNAAETVAAEAECDTVLNSVSGIAGLRPTLAAVESGKTLALANKESLVTYGTHVMKRVNEKGVKVLPVDSEHSAIFQCLSGQRVRRLILTASGGPFYGKTRDQLKGITPADALDHPTWNMGSRITIDSATMMNKGFEVIEAAHLFGIDPTSVDVVVHRESIIHSMVEYIDNAIIAEMGVPDMKLCIQYALTYPERVEGPVKQLDLKSLTSFTFGMPDDTAFPLLPFARRAYAMGGVAPAVMNGADEEAVAMFLREKISFTDISDIVMQVTEDAPKVASPLLVDIEAADKWARLKVRELANR
jgi:1-deoxy-D-xylulose-5-phosphate reductoisomerase